MELSSSGKKHVNKFVVTERELLLKQAPGKVFQAGKVGRQYKSALYLPIETGYLHKKSLKTLNVDPSSKALEGFN